MGYGPGCHGAWPIIHALSFLGCLGVCIWAFMTVANEWVKYASIIGSIFFYLLYFLSLGTHYNVFRRVNFFRWLWSSDYLKGGQESNSRRLAEECDPNVEMILFPGTV